MCTIYTKLKQLSGTPGGDPPAEYYEYQDAVYTVMLPYVVQFQNGLISVTEFYDAMFSILHADA